MKALWLIIKILTVPAWGPLWLFYRFGKFMLLLVIVSAASGCVTNTGKFDKSPCACDFKPFVIQAKEARNA